MADVLAATPHPALKDQPLVWLVVLGVASAIGMGIPQLGTPAFLWVLAILAIPLVLLVESTRHGLLALLLSLAYILGSNGFARLHVNVGPLPFYPGELVLAVSWLVLILHLVRTHRSIGLERGLLKPFALPFLLLYLVATVSFFQGVRAEPLEALRDAAMIYYSSLFFFVPLAIRSRHGLEQALRWFLLGTTALTFLLVLSWAFPLPTFIVGPRVAASSYLGMAIIFELLLLRQGQTRRQRLMTLSLILLQLFVIVYIAQARSAWLGLASVFVFSSLLLGSHGLRLRKVVSSVTLLAVFLAAGLTVMQPALTQQVALKAATIAGFNVIGGMSSENVKIRLGMWGDIIDETLRHPLLGIGLGTPFYFPSLEKRGWVDPKLERTGHDQPHNSHLTVLLRMGIGGLVLWLLVFWRFSRFSLRFIRRTGDPQLRFYATGILLSVVMILAVTTTAPLLEAPYISVPFWLLMGGMLAVANLEPRPTLNGLEDAPG